MKNLTKTAVLAVGVVLAAQAASAAYQVDDLILGFTDAIPDGSGGYSGGGVSGNDYVINLGNAASAVGVGGTTIKNLSSVFSVSTFTTTFGSTFDGNTAMGVVGGNNAGTSARDIFLTQVRSTLGTPSIPGSSAPGDIAYTDAGGGAAVISAMAGASGLNLSAGTSKTPAITSGSSFANRISPGKDGVTTFIGTTGIDPAGYAGSGDTLIYEDLYKAAGNDSFLTFNYVGFFTLNLGGNGASTPTLSFTPAGFGAVPEPATFGLLAGAIVLGLSVYRKKAVR